MYPTPLLLVCCLLALTNLLNAQDDWQERQWPAAWITAPCAPATSFAVVEFSRTFTLAELPDSLPVMVSADNRYRLYANGRLVGMGPERSDQMHWRYATYDLRPYLQPGENRLTATVWNYGFDRARAQESYRLGFVLQPRTDNLAELKTDSEWSVRCQPAYTPITGAMQRLQTYLVVGPQLRIDAHLLPRDSTDFPERAVTVGRAMPRGTDTEMIWPLVPRQIPELELRPLPPPRVIRDDQRVGRFSDTLLPANTRDSFLLDVGHLTNAFFALQTEGGDGAEIRLTYAESLFDASGSKGHRDSIAGKHIRGVYDEFLPDGRPRTFSSLWFRTARYLQVNYVTGDAPLRLRGLDVTEVSYPFEENGSFTTDQSERRIDDILEVGWRTARLCAQEIYVDCPYYEQLQYAGDTRIQALISLYVSGDARLMRKAIQLFEDSRIAEGLTLSRYPDNVAQIIPPYSLMWIMMVYDYAMHVDEPALVDRQLDGVAAVLDWYHRQQLPNGMIGDTPYWNFVDWTPRGMSWNDGVRMGGEAPSEGGNAVISGQYAMALRAAAELFSASGREADATRYAAQADSVAAAVVTLCWNAERQLLADTPGGTSFSQHANIMGLINGGLPASSSAVLDRVLGDASLVPASAYFGFYLAEALHTARESHRYPAFLDQWRGYLDQGCTTWPEQPGETRSDCHAWSSSPNYHLPSLIAGIRPAAPGFREVSVRPADLADFPYVAIVPTPHGEITVDCAVGGGELVYTITLPEGVTGQFSLRDNFEDLRAGTQVVRVPVD